MGRDPTSKQLQLFCELLSISKSCGKSMLNEHCKVGNYILVSVLAGGIVYPQSSVSVLYSCSWDKWKSLIAFSKMGFLVVICPKDTFDSELWGFFNLMMCRVPFFLTLSKYGWGEQGLSDLLHCYYLTDQVIVWDCKDGVWVFFFFFFLIYAFVFSTSCTENGCFCWILIFEILKILSLLK